MKGIQHNRYKHGMTGTRIYGIWNGMLNRCRNKRSNNWKTYGARGIKVDERWHDFNNFYTDMKEGYSETMTLDRIDNDKGYSPDNCRWVDAKEQGRHKSTVKRYEYKGKLLTIPQLAEMHSMKYDTLYRRLKYGWSLGDALSKPLVTTYAEQSHGVRKKAA